MACTTFKNAAFLPSRGQEPFEPCIPPTSAWPLRLVFRLASGWAATSLPLSEHQRAPQSCPHASSVGLFCPQMS